ncbi:polysaccharide biosynthesis/export family protein [Robertkochia sp. 1368]|nr:polysaccharide biosynthesis/export family protein [Robertkochia sediminum]
MHRSGSSLAFIAMAVILMLSSCVSRKKVAYFQNIDQAMAAAKQVNYTPQIQANDMLQITVSSYDLKAVQPFNLPLVNSQGITGMGGGMQNQLQAYLVDSDGNIQFPVLGELKVAGMTRQELIKDLENRIGEYVVDPIINIRIVNYKVSVIGEVTRPGTYNIQDERITLPEALAMAGDMTIYGRRDNVMVIREQNGIKSYGSVDLTKADLIDSPFYYLQQNDVIYIEPNKAQTQAAAYNRNIPLFVSVASIILSVIVVITN